VTGSVRDPEPRRAAREKAAAWWPNAFTSSAVGPSGPRPRRIPATGLASTRYPTCATTEIAANRGFTVGLKVPCFWPDSIAVLKRSKRPAESDRMAGSAWAAFQSINSWQGGSAGVDSPRVPQPDFARPPKRRLRASTPRRFGSPPRTRSCQPLVPEHVCIESPYCRNNNRSKPHSDSILPL